MKFITITLGLLLFTANQLGASPFNQESQFEVQEDINFLGTVGLGNCSGTLVRFENSLPTDFGMVLTNGHCLGGIPDDSALRNRISRRTFKILTSTGREVGTAKATEIVYATQTTTDIAIYQLERSIAAIERRLPTKFITISSERAMIGDSIDIVSGFLRTGYSCQIESIAYQLVEDKYRYNDAIRYSQPGCEVIGGTSGSPIFLQGTRQLVGVNNTANKGTDEPCSLNNPCEVNEFGEITAQVGFSYGQQVSDIYSCINQDRKLDVTVEGCLLPK